MAPSSDFQWGDESTVVHSVSGIAVYPNPDGDIVVRQEDSMEGDEIIYIPRDRAQQVAQAILDALKASTPE